MKLIYILPALYLTCALAKPCGMQGSIEERLRDCSSSNGEFRLVAKVEGGPQIFRDMKTGLIWGDRIRSDFNHYSSQLACSRELNESLGILDLKWRLPTVSEFEEASAHGLKTALPNMTHWFWTSTPVKQAKVKKSRRKKSLPSQLFLWDGQGEVTEAGDLKDGASVRCVARE